MVSQLLDYRSWRSLALCFPSSKSGRPTGRLPRLPAQTHSAAGGSSFSERQRKHRYRDQTLNPLERKEKTAGENILHVREHEAKPSLVGGYNIYDTWLCTFAVTQAMDWESIKGTPDLTSLKLFSIKCHLEQKEWQLRKCRLSRAAFTHVYLKSSVWGFCDLLENMWNKNKSLWFHLCLFFLLTC